MVGYELCICKYHFLKPCTLRTRPLFVPPLFLRLLFLLLLLPPPLSSLSSSVMLSPSCSLPPSLSHSLSLFLPLSLSPTVVLLVSYFPAYLHSSCECAHIEHAPVLSPSLLSLFSSLFPPTLFFS